MRYLHPLVDVVPLSPAIFLLLDDVRRVVVRRVPGFAAGNVGHNRLDSPGPHGRQFLVLRVPQRPRRPGSPVLRRLPQLDCLPRPALDLLRVFPGVAFGMVADQDRLTQRDTVGDAFDRRPGPVRVLFPLLAVLLEPLGPLLGPFGQAGILVVDLAAQLQEQVFPVRRPGRGDEEFLFRCPDKPGSAYPLVEFRR